MEECFDMSVFECKMCKKKGDKIGTLFRGNPKGGNAEIVAVTFPHPRRLVTVRSTMTR